MEPEGPAEAEAVCVDMEFVVDSGDIDVEMMSCEIWELLLALLLVKSYYDSVVCDHTGSQNATRRAEGQWMSQYF